MFQGMKTIFPRTRNGKRESIIVESYYFPNVLVNQTRAFYLWKKNFYVLIENTMSSGMIPVLF